MFVYKVQQHAVHCEYPVGVLKTLQRHCTLLTLTGRHLGYVMKRAGPPTYIQPGAGEHVIYVISMSHEISVNTSKENKNAFIFKR